MWGVEKEEQSRTNDVQGHNRTMRAFRLLPMLLGDSPKLNQGKQPELSWTAGCPSVASRGNCCKMIQPYPGKSFPLPVDKHMQASGPISMPGQWSRIEGCPKALTWRTRSGE